MNAVLVHLASGIGNIVLATPLLIALARRGLEVDVLVDGDYAQTADLLMGWSAVRAVFNGSLLLRPAGLYDVVVPGIPPFYWQRYARHYAKCGSCVARPPDDLFYRDEQAYYLAFANALGCDTGGQHYYFLPIPPDRVHGIASTTLVLAPGCKTGEMAAKRWPHFAELAEQFEDVVVVGTQDDLYCWDGKSMKFPTHVRCLVGELTLRQTAEVLAAAGAVVANDSGLGHIAGAVGVPTVMIFGPTPDRTLGTLPPNVRVLRSGLPCEPCWFRSRFRACQSRIDCLSKISVEMVLNEMSDIVLQRGQTALSRYLGVGPQGLKVGAGQRG